MAYMTGQQVRDYIVKSGFKRTDKDDELYSALTDVVRDASRVPVPGDIV